MRTRVTDLFGIQYPICLSGMSWVSVPRLVAAVSNAGGLGILATGSLSPRQTRESIAEVRALTDKRSAPTRHSSSREAPRTREYCSTSVCP